MNDSQGKASYGLLYPDDLLETIRFHGHMCPGLAIGYRELKIALDILGAERVHNKELIAIVENDSCAVDAVQWLTGFTFGTGNFIFWDYGKGAFTFAVRPSGKSMRSEQDRDRTRCILTAPAMELLDIREKTIPCPLPQIRESVVCEECGECVMVGKTNKCNGRTICVPCSQEKTP